MLKIIEFFARQRLFANVFTFFVLGTGLTTLLLIQREFFPNVNFEVIVVTTVFPGAAPTDVEKKITSPLEEDLNELTGVRKMLSISSAGTGVIVIELDPDEADEQEAKDDVQDIVNRFDKLPDQAELPIVTLIESKLEPVVDIAVYGIEDDVALREEARRLELMLETQNGVARVEPRALRNREIRVEVHPEKMERFNVSLSDVFKTLADHNISVPGGLIEAGGDQPKERIIRTTGEFESIESIEAAAVRANDFGQVVRVGDVATVTKGLEKPDLYYRADGHKAVSLTVLKEETADGISIVEDLQAYITKLQADGLTTAKLSMIDDRSEIIRNRLSILSDNLLLGIILVVGILSLLLNIRISLLVSLSIPLPFFGTIIIFYLVGISLNVVSLIGLIIVSGLLTDNAVVVADNISMLMKRGLSSTKAAVEGTVQVWRSITASTLGIVIAFLPMLFMTGIFGKVIEPIPLGVIIALMWSLVVSFLILPAQFAWIVRDASQTQKATTGLWYQIVSSVSRFWDEVVAIRYRRLLVIVVRARYLTMGITVVAVVAVGTLLFTQMKKILFPAEGIEIFYVRTATPVGTSLVEHDRYLRALEEKVRELPKHEIKNFVTTVGLVGEGETDPNSRRGAQYGQITVFLPPEQQRDRSADQIIEDLRARVGARPQGIDELVFARVQGGPPVGKAISIGVRGSDYDTILPAVEALKESISKIPGALDVDDSHTLGRQELQIRVNDAEATAAGLSVRAIGETVMLAFEGLEATTMRDLTDETKIRVQLPFKERQSRESLEQLKLRTPGGELLPLSRVAKITEVPTIAAIEHEATRRQVRVTGDVDIKVTSSQEVNEKIRDLLPEFQKRFPAVRIAFGGEDQDTRESFEALGRAFVIAFFGIFGVLLLTFGQFLQPLLVLITIPFGTVSALIAFAIHGLPISFMGSLGIIALAGVIVNNAIVLIDFVNQERAAGLDRYESIYEAGSRRLRAIFLSTITNIVGVIPTAYGFGGIDRFVVPIAIALGWGLAMGAILTAICFPAALAIIDDIQAGSQKMRERWTNQRS